jgi:hypothetical protein
MLTKHVKEHKDAKTTFQPAKHANERKDAKNG